MKTTLVLTVDIPPLDVVENIAALTRCILWYHLPEEDGESVHGAIELCDLPFGSYTLRVDA